ncbi:hypothetical protein GGI42DRAFT_333554 [Trichoderma sp. SZMC 28013]
MTEVAVGIGSGFLCFMLVPTTKTCLLCTSMAQANGVHAELLIGAALPLYLLQLLVEMPMPRQTRH